MLTGRWGPAEVYRKYRAHTERIRKNAQAALQRERSRAMRQRWQRAVRRLILVNRLIGHGVPGGGGVLFGVECSDSASKARAISSASPSVGSLRGGGVAAGWARRVAVGPRPAGQDDLGK